MIKNIIRDTKAGKKMIVKLHQIEGVLLPLLISDEDAVKRYYKKKSGRKLDLNNPKSFSEKLNWYKLNGKNPLMAVCADKIEVREYVRKQGYGSALNDVYGVYERVSQVVPDKLPDRFVIKAAHGSHMNIIVKDRPRFNWNKAKHEIEDWLRQNIYWSGREWVYKDLKRRFLIEKYLEDETGELRDYKFFCFNGEPKVMQLEVGRFSGHHIRNFYDMEWNLLPFGKAMPHDPNVNIPRPYLFEDMKKMAAELSQPFQFVRMDLYQVNRKVYFGEMTFFPAGGAPDFIPSSYDDVIGEMWKIVQ